MGAGQTKNKIKTISWNPIWCGHILREPQVPLHIPQEFAGRPKDCPSTLPLMTPDNFRGPRIEDAFVFSFRILWYLALGQIPQNVSVWPHWPSGLHINDPICSASCLRPQASCIPVMICSGWPLVAFIFTASLTSLYLNSSWLQSCLRPAVVPILDLGRLISVPSSLLPTWRLEESSQRFTYGSPWGTKHPIQANIIITTTFSHAAHFPALWLGPSGHYSQHPARYVVDPPRLFARSLS